MSRLLSANGTAETATQRRGLGPGAPMAGGTAPRNAFSPLTGSADYDYREIAGSLDRANLTPLVKAVQGVKPRFARASCKAFSAR